MYWLPGSVVTLNNGSVKNEYQHATALVPSIKCVAMFYHNSLDLRKLVQVSTIQPEISLTAKNL
jgi:hypothetical protein